MNDKKIDELVTLVVHNVRYPEQSMPNKPETFGLDPTTFPKEAMSLGKYKFFPRAVWATVYGRYKGCPMDRLSLIRSRLQYFIDCNSFKFMNGLANAVPNSKFVEFNSVIKAMTQEFNDAKENYLNNYGSLKIASVDYWRCEAHKFNITPEQMKATLKKKFWKEDYVADRFLFGTLCFKCPEPNMLAGDDNVDPAIIEAKQVAAAAAASEITKSVAIFKKEAVMQIREGVIDALQGLVDAITTGKYNQKSINGLKKYLENIESINFMNDEAISNRTKEILAVINDQEAQLLKKNDNKRELLQQKLKHHLTVIRSLPIPVISEEVQAQEAAEKFLNIGRVEPF